MDDEQIFNFWLHRDCMDAIRAGDMKKQFICAVREILKASREASLEEAAKIAESFKIGYIDDDSDIDEIAEAIRNAKIVI